MKGEMIVYVHATLAANEKLKAYLPGSANEIQEIRITQDKIIVYSKTPKNIN